MKTFVKNWISVGLVTLIVFSLALSAAATETLIAATDEAIELQGIYALADVTSTEVSQIEADAASFTAVDTVVFDDTEVDVITASETSKTMTTICNTSIASNVSAYATAQRYASIASQMATRSGMLGRFRVDSVGIDVALFSSGSQATVDAYDSASCYEPAAGSNCLLIGDHNTQAFATLSQCTVGTIAYIDTGSGSTKYVCTAKFSGHNVHGVGACISDANYNSIYYSNSGGLTTYTCQDCWQNVWVLFWQPA